MPTQLVITAAFSFVAGFFFREITKWIRSKMGAVPAETITAKKELPSRIELDHLVEEFAPKGLWTPVTELGNKCIQIYATDQAVSLDELILTEGDDMIPEGKYTVKEALERNIVSLDEVSMLIADAICYYDAKGTWEPGSHPGNTYAIS